MYINRYISSSSHLRTYGLRYCRSRSLQSVQKLQIQTRSFSNDKNKLAEFLSVWKDNIKEEMVGQKLDDLPPANPEHEDKGIASRFLHQLKENFEEDIKKEFKGRLPENPFGGGQQGFKFSGSLAARRILRSFLENCHKEHAQKIANEMGVQLRSIDFDTSEATPRALIDAPNATEEQVQTLAERVRNECPMASVNRATGGKDVEFIKVRK